MEIVIERQFQVGMWLLTSPSFSNVAVEVLIHGSDDETDRPQAIGDIWEDLSVLHKL